MTDSPNSEQDRKDARVVSRHLPSGYSADPDVITVSKRNGSTADSSNSGAAEDSLRLLGGDMHRDIFKIKARGKQPQRSATFSGVIDRSSDNNTGNQAPGGFRRDFLLQQSRRFSSVTGPVTSNFVSFLDLYGGFAGEDLFESDDESAVEDEEDGAQPNERRPLLGRRKSTKASKKGDASQTKTFFTLIKAFIGTGIMFLPKGWSLSSGPCARG